MPAGWAGLRRCVPCTVNMFSRTGHYLESFDGARDTSMEILYLDWGIIFMWAIIFVTESLHSPK